MWGRWGRRALGGVLGGGVGIVAVAVAVVPWRKRVCGLWSVAGRVVRRGAVRRESGRWWIERVAEDMVGWRRGLMGVDVVAL